jgi:hypothetical protein
MIKITIFLFTVSIIPSLGVFFSLLVNCVVTECRYCEQNSCRLVYYSNMTVLKYLVRIPQITFLKTVLNACVPCEVYCRYHSI